MSAKQKDVHSTAITWHPEGIADTTRDTLLLLLHPLRQTWNALRNLQTRQIQRDNTRGDIDSRRQWQWHYMRLSKEYVLVAKRGNKLKQHFSDA